MTKGPGGSAFFMHIAGAEGHFSGMASEVPGQSLTHVKTEPVVSFILFYYLILGLEAESCVSQIGSELHIYFL